VNARESSAGPAFGAEPLESVLEDCAVPEDCLLVALESLFSGLPQ
jgi:hypothetical protein